MSTTSQLHYEILGVTPLDDLAAITAAYRRRARDCHPDVRPNDPDAVAEFKAVTTAFEVLSDPERRRRYDESGDWSHCSTDARVRRDAITIISNLIKEMIGGDIRAGRDPSSRAMVDDLKRALETKLREFESKLKELAKSRQSIEDVASRFTCAAGEENLLAAIAREPLAEIDATIKQANHAIAAHKEAIVIVRKFNFTAAGGWDTWQQGGAPVFWMMGPGKNSTGNAW